MFSHIRARFRTRAACRALLLPAAIATLMASPALAQDLSLDDAIRRVLDNAPHNAAVSAQTEALQASREAASLRPRPNLEVVTENFGPPIGDLYDQFQITATYSQQIERGGKRDARLALAERQIDVVGAQAVAQRLDLIAGVQLAYVEVQAAEADIAVMQQRLTIARDFQTEVARRVASARDPIFAGTRASTAVAEAEVDLELALHARDAALARLSLWWGGQAEGLVVPLGMFLELDGIVGPVEPAPADVAVYQARGAAADAAIAVQQANSARDLTVSGGPRIIGNGDVGLVAGVSVPLGGRRLTEARVREAQAERRRVDAELEVAQFRLRRELALAAERVEEARHEAEAVQQRVLPGAEQALREVRLGYNRGFFSFADVSAAQTAVTDAASRTVDAAREYHEAHVELDRLTGRFTILAQEATR